MKTDLFIPKTITVGFQKRNDTFTGKLAYIIYTDAKGVLRKKTSWEGWRHKDIEPLTFDNTPQPNFALNKGIARDGYWGNGRSMIRIWDPRDFEFEIEIDNLMGILMHSDVFKRDITEPCVYAWNGTSLVLLPTNSIEYQESMKHTDKQSMKVGAKELGIGYTYEIKSGREQVVYLGRFPVYNLERERVQGRHGFCKTIKHVEKRPQHVFYDLKYNRIDFKSPTAYLAQVVSEECHPEYANMMDKFYQIQESQHMVSIALVPTKLLETIPEDILNSYGAHAEKDRGARAVSDILSYKVNNTYWVQIDEHRYIRLEIKVELLSYYASQPTIHVSYERAAVFDPEVRELNFSVNIDHRYSHNRDIPDIVFPDFNIKTQVVQDKIQQIRNDLQNAIVANWVPIKYGNAPLTPEVAYTLANLVAVAKKHQFGSLRPVLQNGNIAKDELY